MSGINNGYTKEIERLRVENAELKAEIRRLNSLLERLENLLAEVLP